MPRVISNRSIAKANYRIITGRSCVTGRDGTNVTAIVNTAFGNKKIIVSREAVVKAGSEALKRYSR
jgi:hypothetical protein